MPDKQKGPFSHGPFSHRWLFRAARPSGQETTIDKQQ
jgi:hypothetical protein